MQPRSAALLWDLATALRRVQDFVRDKSFEVTPATSAVERQFEIAGDALSVLRKLDLETADEVPNTQDRRGCATF